MVLVGAAGGAGLLPRQTLGADELPPVSEGVLVVFQPDGGVRVTHVVVVTTPDYNLDKLENKLKISIDNNDTTYC